MNVQTHNWGVCVHAHRQHSMKRSISPSLEEQNCDADSSWTHYSSVKKIKTDGEFLTSVVCSVRCLHLPFSVMCNRCLEYLLSWGAITRNVLLQEAVHKRMLTSVALKGRVIGWDSSMSPFFSFIGSLVWMSWLVIRFAIVFLQARWRRSVCEPGSGRGGARWVLGQSKSR